jgi:hypothetical protein
MIDMPENLSPKLYAFLRDWGMSEKSFATCTRETRLWHDLGYYGDIAESFLEELERKHQVDLGEFEFQKYFPIEAAGNHLFTNVIAIFLPFLAFLRRAVREYEPITLGMIDDAMVAKRLV